MSTEENKAVIRRYVEEVINTGNVALAEQFCAPDYTNYMLPEGMRDVEGFKQLIRSVRAGFPDITWTIENLIAEGDEVVARTTIRGTHQGEYQGIPATGKTVTLPMLTYYRVVNGKIVEDHPIVNELGLLQQLGVMPVPEAAEA